MASEQRVVELSAVMLVGTEQALSMVLPWLSFMNILLRSSSAPAFAKHCRATPVMICMTAPCSGGLLFRDCFCSGHAWRTEYTVSLETAKAAI